MKGALGFQGTHLIEERRTNNEERYRQMTPNHCPQNDFLKKYAAPMTLRRTFTNQDPRITNHDSG